METTAALLALGLVLLVVLGLMLWAALWMYRDARRRGIEPAWLLLLFGLLQFPWPWLTYLVVTRSLDRAGVRLPGGSAPG